MQTLILTIVLVWAFWTAFGVLLPKARRQLRGHLARWANGKLPASWVEKIRPGFPNSHCGCGTQCHDDTQKEVRRKT